MIAENLELTAELRNSMGKSAVRRMRQFDDKVPGIVYGAGKIPQAVSLLRKDILKALQNTAVFSSVLTLRVGDEQQKVVLKNLQRHCIKSTILHIDFQRIKATEKITINIPLHFIGEDECSAVKQGGVISHLQTEVAVRCLPANLPEYIVVDLSKLKLNESFRLSDLKLPSEVELTVTSNQQRDLPLVSVHILRVNQADIEAEETIVADKSSQTGETKSEVDTNEKE
ncbi:50S ribosomal protein L25/general stress protein Ctc [Coxiella endosymbiont of Amblyomma nuttalli]|uniref:50S ribosomal protein L25/general stress protein Ctc n=1 Tax=Coxiella endosymbiont of Amblyomma nuttalli TaxID=2749996 RepID=UPI001BA48CC5|nr:50S ribosomal protein L25 [Coxiella endosymbiont of Amblyomma nuttalli]